MGARALWLLGSLVPVFLVVLHDELSNLDGHASVFKTHDIMQFTSSIEVYSPCDVLRNFILNVLLCSYSEVLCSCCISTSKVSRTSGEVKTFEHKRGTCSRLVLLKFTGFDTYDGITLCCACAVKLVLME